MIKPKNNECDVSIFVWVYYVIPIYLRLGIAASAGIVGDDITIRSEFFNANKTREIK